MRKPGGPSIAMGLGIDLGINPAPTGRTESEIDQGALIQGVSEGGNVFNHGDGLEELIRACRCVPVARSALPAVEGTAQNWEAARGSAESHDGSTGLVS
eukprot:15452373-Alexandrium_andersonii.AAC.2